MELGFFLYSTVIIGIAIIICSVSLVVWLMTSRRDCLCAAAGFAFYALSCALIFFDEYSREKYDYSEIFEQPLLHPIATTVLGIAAVACIWIWVLMRTHAPVGYKPMLALVVPFSVVCFALVPRDGSASTLQQYLYWLWRDLGLVFCLAYIAWRYRFRSTELERLDLARSRTFYVVACALTACIIAEDTWMILIWQPTLASEFMARFLWYFSERNFSENMLMVACAAQLLLRYRGVLVVYAQHPQTEGITEGERPAVREEDLQSRIVIFGDAHGLSAREQEVLGCVLRGFDAQNIASELVISVGTVKAHLHRIYVKVDVPGKDELVKEFWRS